MDRFSSRSRRLGPKVHKNRRIEDKWGQQYHRAVQNTVFGRQCLPYMPTEPPASLSEEIVESGPLYVCKQCKDCFRFQSSFEDHNTRHSWILGLWCHMCFKTVCTHISETGRSTCIKCSTCIKQHSDKRAYLRARGLNKSQRWGAVRVFYNQCQFIEHLKMHRLSSVNMGDLMLIPLPLNMSSSDWSPEFEMLCEALMEQTFLLRIHIIDWFKMHNLQDNWWKLVNGKSNDNIISKIVDGYQGRQIFETNYNSSDATYDDSKSSLDMEFDSNFMDKNIDSYSASIISDKNILENEDNPCTATDITFVDCGPASQCFEPEIPVNCETHKKQSTAQEIKNCRLANTVKMNNRTTNETFKNRNSLETNTIHESAVIAKAGNYGSSKSLAIIQPTFKDYVQQRKTAQPPVKKTARNNPNKLITKTGVSKIPDNSFKISIPFPAKTSNIKTNLDPSSLQTTRVNNNILTLQDPKNIASIISQLPPHFISNKKVVFIGQDCNVIAHGENEVITKKDSSNSLVGNGGTGSNTSTQIVCDSNAKKQEITGKIIMKDGKKYIIKRTKEIMKEYQKILPKRSPNLLTVKNVTKATKQLAFEHNVSKPKLTSTNSNENIGVQQITSLHNNSVLTPSPSPSELSSSSSCELHVKKSVMPKLQEVPPHLIPISAMAAQKYISETISLIKEENGDLYMDIKVVDRIAKESFLSVCDVIVKYRREMFDEFYQMNNLELKERLEHLQCVTEEMRQVLNFISDAVFKEKLRAVNTLRCVIEVCFEKCNQDVQNKKNDDVILNEWETRMESVYKCLSCDRFIKPKSYIAGFSKLPKNANAYCSCYKQVCHECQSYQGTTSRFIAHQNYHKKSKPYICPDCGSKFNSFTSLEIHTWTACFHMSKKITFTCKICEIDGFRDLESVTRHFVIMHSKTKVGCEDCSRVFTLYNEYVQHCTETHPSKTEQNPVRLGGCKLSNVILRCENYMLYLEKYPGIRKLVWFKCPCCHLITTDNKHVSKLMNTHIRDNHVERMSKILSKEAFTEIFGTKYLKADKNFIQQFFKVVSDNTFANEVPCTDDTMMPKIVNTRTISSEIFERGSQNTEWSADADMAVAEDSQTMKKTNGKERKDLLPKIINVRSINDLKSSRSKEAITKLDDSKSSSQEETAKELDEDNELNASHISESEKPPLADAVDVRVNSSNKSSKKVSNAVSEASTDNRKIKIVDFRKICKPDIEQHVIAEMCDIRKDENASYMASIPKPPPLTRIPQHLLEANKPENGSENEPVDGSKKSKSKRSSVRGADKSKVRIALGTDVQEEESIDYLCHLCNERINTSQFVVQAHFREKHSDEYRMAVVTPQLSRISHDFINGGYKQFINNKKRKSDSALYVCKRKRRWTPKKHVETKDTNSQVGLCVKQETAEDGDGNFICKKCGQRCADMPDLREHIAANHRLKDRYLICLECGENFVVAPSLQMHLKAFHGIDDPVNYMNQNPSYAPSFDGDLQTEGRTTVANQCHVCMAVFEDKAAVDKHLRVHGMAFLNRKRIEARNALEKKANTEEEKQNIVKDDSKEAAKGNKPAETILDKINAAI
ncbi:PREDICTED: uncharacterized protein LOC105458493 isoform X2 [Wasmannia auropunctata]|uniref:uncharacterized protein LOC105458493 isoform X1 n=1 Tax=Wasmannia auropunctata TaxID=64793 RepID=UPI0005EFF90A|nr:PREDICTED: uncharacterized protein LOC105458493 isoform X1 [Wasmannia auropunctata]XP_011702138.1 PREDICTED: uncharacterized protein LOC105458493 isoform X1 [Wasmannia auropunctata]XP_011702139.1 PREDICTED: uncharacterized protein LOC105458493 isoform X2 [Wasmannia auropunctata]